MDTSKLFIFINIRLILIVLFNFCPLIQINGMEGGDRGTKDSADLNHLKAYYELRGKQVERCIHDREFSQAEKVRWVQKLELLWGSKKILTKANFDERFRGQEYSWSQDSRYIQAKTTHEKISHVGAMLKILNGYYYYRREPGELWNGITPGRTNFLVPFINFIIKYDKEESCFIEGDYLRHNDGRAVTFVSGSGDYTDKAALEASFNLVLKKPQEPNILIISGNNITNQQNISWDRFSNDHTEYFLVTYASAYHETLLNPLKKLKEKNNSTACLKAIILDVHSWMDICNSCYPYFFSQWDKVINSPSLHEEIRGIGFSLSKKNNVKVIIRMSSEAKPKDCYDNLDNLSNSNAGGGINVFDNGFDAKVIASQQCIIATRRDIKEKHYRDELIKEFWQKHLEACLYKPYDFWLENPKIFFNMCELSQHYLAQDMLMLLAKLHQQENAFLLASAKASIDSYCLVNCSVQKLESISISLQQLIESSSQSFAKESVLLDFLKHFQIKDIEIQKKYASTFYVNLCLKLLKRSIEEESGIKRIHDLIIKFWKCGLKKEEIVTESTEINIIEQIIYMRYSLPTKNNTYNTQPDSIEIYENKNREELDTLFYFYKEKLKKDLGHDYWDPKSANKFSNKELQDFFQQYTTSSSQGDTICKINGLFSITKYIKDKDYNSFYKHLDECVVSGHSGAQYMLAIELIAKEKERSLHLIHQSAAQGYPKALYELGMAYASESKFFNFEKNMEISKLLISEANKLGYQESK